jgi:hypothetical protein
MLDDHVERRHRFVGDHDVRVERERHRDHRPLPHPAGKLVGVVVEAVGREPDQGEELDRPLPRLPMTQTAAVDQHFTQLRPDPVDRIERVHRRLRHHADLAPAQAAHLLLFDAGQIATLEPDLAPGDPSIARQHPE